MNPMNESSILKTNINSKSNIKVLTNLTYLSIKRFFDIIISVTGLIVLSPIFLLIAILIKLEDQGKVFHIQERIGKNGKNFQLYKFRSMIHNADEVLNELLKDPEVAKEYKKHMKLIPDPRITKIGSFIRKTSLDELPQLLNVLKGNMSLIGNRPYLPREREDIGIYYSEIIKTKPGITGYWQTSGRSNLSFKERCKLESFYSNNMSFKMDLKIFFLTFYVVLFKKGAE